MAELRQFYSVTAMPETGVEQVYAGPPERGRRFTREPTTVAVVPAGQTPSQDYELTQEEFDAVRKNPNIRVEAIDGPPGGVIGPAPITPDNLHTYEALAQARANGEPAAERDAQGKTAMQRQQEAWAAEQRGMLQSPQPPPQPAGQTVQATDSSTERRRRSE